MPKDDQQKLNPLSIEMMLVGYEPGSKSYQLWNPKKRSIIMSCDVTFDKCCFLARVSSEPSVSPVPLVIDGPVTIEFPAIEQWNLEPSELLQTHQNPPVPSRETTVFHTPPSCLPHACAVRIQRDPGT
jgi:hypothetical protein